MSEAIAKLETELFNRISTAQRNGLSPSMAIAVGAKPLLEQVAELGTPKASPPIGENRLCLVCAYEKPWGVFDSKTGAIVCVECRDKARARQPVSANRIAMEVTEFLVDKGIAPPEQHPDYRLEIAYRIGYEDAIRNYATWNGGEQFVGAMRRPLKNVLVQFKNSEIPERY